MLKRTSEFRMVGAAAVVALVSAVALVGTGFNRSVVHVLDVGAWVRSIGQGTVQHVNGASGKVDESLHLSIASDPAVQLVNTPHGAALLDRNTGKLQMIDNSKLPQAASPTAAGRSGDVELVSNGTTTWLVQPRQGTAATVSPATGVPVPLHQPIASAAVDGQGRLWAATGNRVTPVADNGKQGSAVTVGNAGDHIDVTAAGGTAYAYDQSSQTLTALGPPGSPVSLPIAPGATGVVAADEAGSSGSPVAVVVPDAGVVVRASPGSAGTQTIRLPGRAGHNLGGAVTLGPALLVPDHTTGELLVVNPQTEATHAYHVTPASSGNGAFDLQVKDGIAYANDPTGNQCLAVSSDAGGIQVAYVVKYRTASPTAATTHHIPAPSPTVVPQPAPSPATTAAPAPAVVAQPAVSPPPTVPAPVVAAQPTVPQPTVPQPTPTLPPPVAPQPAVTSAPPTTVPPRPTTPSVAPPAPTTPSTAAPPPPAPPPPVTAAAPSPPSPPTAVVASAGDGAITVNWTPPPPAGNPATSWVVSWGAGVSQQVSGTSTTITGLANGQAYHVTVQARNAAGLGSAVNATPDPVVPRAAVPGAPTGISVKAGNGSATVSWTAPAGAVKDYQVTTQPAASSQPVVVPAGTTSATVPSLTNGTSYQVTVTAVGPSGGTSSATGGPVTPLGPAGQVSGISLTQAGATSLDVNFGGAAANGSAISQYEATATGGGTTVTAQGSSSPIRLNGLSVGATYSISVRAENAAGWGPSTGAGSFQVAPVATVSVTASGGSQSATVNVAVATNGDPAPSGCVVEYSGASVQGSCGAISVPNLTAGQAYSFDAYAVINGVATARSAAASATPYYQASVANTYGDPSNTVILHSGPSTSDPQTGTTQDGASIQIMCQAMGSTVYGTIGGSSAVWDQLTSGSWISDLYTSTPNVGSFSPGIAQCG